MEYLFIENRYFMIYVSDMCIKKYFMPNKSQDFKAQSYKKSYEFC
jgi:hypothetical protein